MTLCVKGCTARKSTLYKHKTSARGRAEKYSLLHEVATTSQCYRTYEWKHRNSSKISTTPRDVLSTFLPQLLLIHKIGEWDKRRALHRSVKDCCHYFYYHDYTFTQWVIGSIWPQARISIFPFYILATGRRTVKKLKRTTWIIPASLSALPDGVGTFVYSDVLQF